MDRYDVTFTVSGYFEAENTEDADDFIEEIKRQLESGSDLIWPVVTVGYVTTIENREQLTLD